MSKITHIDIAGKKYPMSFSLGAAKKLISKFGSADKMQKKLKENENDTEKIEAMTEILELLIAQGCAYKNYFEKDIPAPKDAPVDDGKWVPLPREAIDIAIGIYDAEEVADKIMECIGDSSKKTVEAKPERKNAGATQE